ncbi:odorant receptor 33a-like [Lucilia cuprina]|uniref:odorant receptor 33a-like n=1 Tax=Lucilia cuprina TaxID=7375 RepID=UPI001F063A69|nr:odorant receptor 33a-like [Lucilia cuprina]
MAQSNTYLPDSVGVFKPFWLCWRLLGVLSWQRKDITMIYDIFMNLFINIWYPVHLTVGLILLPMHDEIYKNMSITITCIVCTLKHYCIRWKLREILKIMDLFGKLDKRIHSLEERKYFTKYNITIAKLLAKLYFSVYMGANVAALVALLWDSERRLMYPAWFPFDWSSSSGLYYSAILYQFVGVTILIVLNFTNDAFGPVTLCLFSGQVHLLSMRVAKLGYDKKKSAKQNENELNLCIEDHIKLINLFNITEDSISYVQLILFISSGLNICVVLVYLFFYVDNLFAYIYYTTFLAAIAVELFPIYYYGSILQEEFNNLPYAIFSSNWPSQTRSYRQNAVVFGEVALRKITMLAGGVVGIRLDSFFAICKMAYSLFAVAMTIK